MLKPKFVGDAVRKIGWTRQRDSLSRSNGRMRSQFAEALEGMKEQLVMAERMKSSTQRV